MLALAVNATALTRLRFWMENQGFLRFFVQHPENFAWLTGGGDNTLMGFRPVSAWLEITSEAVRLHSSQIEAGRLLEEEAPGVEVVRYPWYSPLSGEGPTDLEHDLTPLRLVLTKEEQRRYRALGLDAAAALGECIRVADPGQSEYDLAGAIAEELLGKGIQPLVLLVAGEERIFRYRHPIPKQRPLGRLFMGVICGRRYGLIANVSRLRSFGHPEAKALGEHICQVEAAALEASRPGATLGEVLEKIRAGYKAIGRASEFENHHQGGLTGYRSREVLARPGAKVEDTFLITENGLENLTPDPRWPMMRVEGCLRPTVYEE